jgi:MmyB-like transcription regulator ligand binding domain
VVPVSFRHGERAFRFFSAVTVLGTPQDITLQELRIECFFPLDEASAALARSLKGPDRTFLLSTEHHHCV